MHVSDVGTAVIDVLRHDGPLDPVYNLEGFKARASEIVADIGAMRPARGSPSSRPSRRSFSR